MHACDVLYNTTREYADVVEYYYSSDDRQTEIGERTRSFFVDKKI
jgi:hypothetical protein